MQPGNPSLATLKVLRALLDNAARPHYGLELIRASGVRGGALYPILARLEADGWILGEWEDLDEAAAGRRRRRYYRLSARHQSEVVEALSNVAARLTPPEPSPLARRPGRGWAPS
jgi:DNA-binding PadR family transcriptional regulator